MNANAIAIAVTLIEDIRNNAYPLQFVSMQKLERTLECEKHLFGIDTVRGQTIYDYSDGMDLHQKMAMWCLKNFTIDFIVQFNENMSYGKMANRLIEREIIKRMR